MVNGNVRCILCVYFVRSVVYVLLMPICIRVRACIMIARGRHNIIITLPIPAKCIYHCAFFENKLVEHVFALCFMPLCMSIDSSICTNS